MTSQRKLSRHIGRVAIAVSLLAISLASAAQDGQEEDFYTANGEIEVARMPFQLKGNDIPRYYLVGSFLDFADLRYRDDSRRSTYLTELGIKEGSNAELALARAIDRHRLLVFGPEGPVIETSVELFERPTGGYGVTEEYLERGRNDGPSRFDGVDPEEARAQLQKENELKATSLADIYYDLVRDLAENGIQADTIEKYIRDYIAPSSSLASDKPLDTLRPYALAFERRLSERDTRGILKY